MCLESRECAAAKRCYHRAHTQHKSSGALRALYLRLRPLEAGDRHRLRHVGVGYRGRRPLLPAGALRVVQCLPGDRCSSSPAIAVAIGVPRRTRQPHRLCAHIQDMSQNGNSCRLKGCNTRSPTKFGA